jgi:ABC-2 type transport system permease protein
MLAEIFRFEVRYQLRQPLFYICLVIFFLLTFGAVTTDSVQIGGSIGNVNRNAPFVIMQILAVMSAIGIFTTTAFVAGAIQRDFEHGTAPLFFATPLKKHHYFGGRFAGSLLTAFLVFVAVVLAIIIGSAMPWLEAERIGPFIASPYLFSMLVIVLPNVFFTGAVFFAVAALTRSMLATYVAVAIFFVGYSVAQTMLADVDNELLASLLDPFGISSFALATRYWTVFDKNTATMPLSGALLWNRLLWIAAGAAVLAFGYRRFRLTANLEERKKAKRRRRVATAEAEVAPASTATAVSRPAQDFSHSANFRQYLSQSRIEFSGVIRGVPFIVMFLIGMLNIVGNSFAIDSLYGTPVHPGTNLMLLVIQGAFLLFGLLLMTFYGGELTFRERTLKLNEVYDALPVRTWVYWASKLTALAMATVVLFGGAIVTAMGIQMARGYTNFELPLYFKGLFLETGPAFLYIAVLALFFQVVTNQKFVGFLGMVVYFVSLFALPAMDFEHHLYLYASAPEAIYSDMNGYGHFAAPLLWFMLYWGFVAAVLTVIVHLFWVRGTEPNWQKRFAIAKQRFTAGPRAALAVALLGVLATGGFIFYNTNILNQYRTSDDREKTLADYEKNYKSTRASRSRASPMSKRRWTSIPTVVPPPSAASTRFSTRLRNRSARSSWW